MVTNLNNHVFLHPSHPLKIVSFTLHFHPWCAQSTCIVDDKSWLSLNKIKINFSLHEFKVTLQFMETFRYIIFIAKIENESSTTKQTWLDEMKIWYVCLFKHIWWSFSLIQIWFRIVLKIHHLYCILIYCIWMSFSSSYFNY
jgi:hypothetical protein